MVALNNFGPINNMNETIIYVILCVFLIGYILLGIVEILLNIYLRINNSILYSGISNITSYKKVSRVASFMGTKDRKKNSS